MRCRRPSRRLICQVAVITFVLSLVLAPALGRAWDATPPSAATPGACERVQATLGATASAAASATATQDQSLACATPRATPTLATAYVTLELIDIKYEPAQLTIPANQEVTIRLMGRGIAAHNFNIDELKIHTEALTYGKSLDLTITAAPGTYVFYCSFPGHKQAGMIGRLIVK